MPDLDVLVTLWPNMPHYVQFAKDKRVKGIRLNTAMTNTEELPSLLSYAREIAYGKPLYFDVKGWQLRITEISPRKDRLECMINHAIKVETPTPVLFKAGADGALLKCVEDGKKLIFDGGPEFNLRVGESLHIRHPSLTLTDYIFPPEQREYLQIAKAAGFTHYMLSYAHAMNDVHEMRRYIGDAHVDLKIEDRKGLAFVTTDYVKTPNLGLLTARGDLFVEVEKPHQILNATKQIIKADQDAIIGSRLLLSVTEGHVPSCADINELAWLFDLGYRRFLFCDGLCLKPEALDRALDIMYRTYDEYVVKQTN